MGNLARMEEQMALLVQTAGVSSCLICARAGQANILFEHHVGAADRRVLGSLVSCLLNLGEKLAQELGEPADGYQLLRFGDSDIALIPCGEAAALLLIFRDSGNSGAALGTGLDVARGIGNLLHQQDAQS